MDINKSPEEIFEMLKLNIMQNKDNHSLPQYKFVVDDNDNILNNVHIFHTELLEYEMHDMGHDDFNLKENCNRHSANYMKMLNKNSVKLINAYYLMDFKLFNYDIIQIN
jgi:hypothetical protein